MEQRFALPGLPFRRELPNAFHVGTQISVRASPYNDQRKVITVALLASSVHVALEVSIHLNGRPRLKALARLNNVETSAIDKELTTVAVEKEFVLNILVKEHVFEIIVDNIFITPFVHRINPSDISEIVVEGPIICNEIVIIPVKSELPPPPEYSSVSLNPTRNPIQPERQVPGIAPFPSGTVVPSTLPPSSSSSSTKPPYPYDEKPTYPPSSISVASSASPRPSQPMPMPAPYPTQPSSIQPMPAPHPPQPSSIQPMPAPQRPGAAPQMPPPGGSQIPGTIPQMPGAPPVGFPPGYNTPGLAPQGYPQNPTMANVQMVPGISYPAPPQPGYPGGYNGQPPYYAAPAPVVYQQPHYVYEPYYDPCHSYYHHHHHC